MLSITTSPSSNNTQGKLSESISYPTYMYVYRIHDMCIHHSITVFGIYNVLWQCNEAKWHFWMKNLSILHGIDVSDTSIKLYSYSNSLECREPAREQLKLNCCRCKNGFRISWEISRFRVGHISFWSVMSTIFMSRFEYIQFSERGIWSRISDQFAPIFEENIAVKLTAKCFFSLSL